MCSCDKKGRAKNSNKLSQCDCNLKLEGFVVPCLLLLLFKEGPSHGYHLIEKLSNLPLFEAIPDPAVVYRHLRLLESDGMIESRLEEGTRGPARKVYSLTEDGEAYLEAWIPVIKARRDSLENFLKVARDLYE